MLTIQKSEKLGNSYFSPRLSFLRFVRMTVSVLECSRCHMKFNYEWSRGASASSVRLGNRDIFKCPICKEFNRFNLANRGRDPTFPTYNELQVGIGWRIWVWLLGPSIGLMTIGITLSITLTASPYYQLFLVPLLGGFAWLAAYVYFLNKKHGT